MTVFTDKRVPHLPAVEKTNNAQLKVAQRNGVIHILSALDNLTAYGSTAGAARSKLEGRTFCIPGRPLPPRVPAVSSADSLGLKACSGGVHAVERSECARGRGSSFKRWP